MITFDSSGLVALLRRDDPHHPAAVGVLRASPGPGIVPMGALCEVTYLLDRYIGQRAVVALLDDIADGAFLVDGGENDLARVRELVVRYADLPLGFADAAVIACAERRGGRVLTFDLRHFGVVAREGTIRIEPSSA